MKLAHKIRKLAQPLTYRRAWRRVRRSFFPLPLAPLRAKIDLKRLREIQQHYTDSSEGFTKCTDVDRYLRVNRERVQDLKLHRSTRKRVLDLGCGGGFFLFILKKLGHSVLGLDVGHIDLYTELVELFDFLVSRGATVERERILFEKGLRFPSVSYATFGSKDSELASVAEADNHELHG